MLIRVFDFETTGIPTDDDRQAVCEVGWTDIVATLADPQTGLTAYEVGRPSSMLINPGRPIPLEAMSVHHIMDEDVAGAPSPDAVAHVLADHQPDHYWAHNADFERQFWSSGRILCSYKVALRFWPEAPKHNNSFLRYFLRLPVDRSLCEPVHRAGPDSYVTAHLVARILAEASERGVDLATMERWSNGPALLPRCPIGKHRGKPWPEVPTSFLNWMVGVEDMDRDLKANARHHLKSRGDA